MKDKIKIPIHDNWSIIAYIKNHVLIQKEKNGKKEHSIWLPTDVIIKLGEWLNLKKQLEEFERKY